MMVRGPSPRARFSQAIDYSIHLFIAFIRLQIQALFKNFTMYDDDVLSQSIVSRGTWDFRVKDLPKGTLHYQCFKSSNF